MFRMVDVNFCILGLELNPENEERPSTCETDDEIANVDSTVEDQGNSYLIFAIFPSIFLNLLFTPPLLCHA